MNPATVVITGGTKGLGRELSLAFARHGHRVVALYASDAEAAEQLDADLTAESLPGASFRHDVTDDREDAPVWRLPEIVNASSLVLVHNAAPAFTPKPLHLLTWGDFAPGIEVALKGGWLCAQALLRPMVSAGRGVIVNVLSTALAGPPPKGFTAYAAAKAALRALSESLSAEYSERGVKVFTVSPGFMDTALTEPWHALLKDAIAGPAGPADPAVVAANILALVEDDAIPGRGENYDV